MEFNIGDRVTVKPEYGFVGNTRRIVDETLVGTVCVIDMDMIGVAFDEDIKGHDCDGACARHHGWWIRERHLLHVEESLPPIPEDKLMEVLFDG